MRNIIVQVASNEQFRRDIGGKLGKVVDTSEYEAQVEQISKQIRNNVTFKFPLTIGGKALNMLDYTKQVNGQTTGDNVETVCLLYRKNS